MKENANLDVSIKALKSLLMQRGYDYEYFPDDHSVVFIDGMGTVHECWPAGSADDLVNVAIAVTPEEALSVKDLNGIIAENARLRELLAGACKDLDACQRVIASSNQWGYGKGYLERLWELQEAMKELGMEVGLDECE